MWAIAAPCAGDSGIEVLAMTYLRIDGCEYDHCGRNIDGCQSVPGSMTPVPASLPVLNDLSACCTPLSASPLSDEAAATLAKAFAALGDPVRLRLLSLLMTADGGQVCACDLVEPVGKSQPTVSHHLKVLRQAGLVSATRRGQNIWYAVVPEQVAALRDVLASEGR
jgi:ArsR family transcriptional regulator